MLTKEDAKKIKGIAIILMLMYHLFYFKDRIYGGGVISIISNSLVENMGKFGNICVPIFFFLSGYGLYINSKKKEYDLFYRIKKIYLDYWKIFVIFVPIAIILFKYQPSSAYVEFVSNRYNHFSIIEFIKCFIGIEPIYNGEWWFIRSYVIALISFPLLKIIIDKNKPSINIFITMILSIVLYDVIPLLKIGSNPLFYTFINQTVHITSFIMGMIFASSDMFKKIDKSLEKNNYYGIIKDILFIGLIFFLRNYQYGEQFDLLFVPMFILFALDFIKRIKITDKVLMLLGDNSTNMWLIHTFYCYYIYYIVKLVLLPKYSILCLLLLIILSLITSIIIEYIYKKIKRMIK